MILMIILFAIPVLLVIILVRHMILRHQLKADKTDNAALYKEIGRLNKQVLSLMEEKNSILALKVNAMGGTKRIPYVGASALTDDVLPTVGEVTSGKGLAGAAGVPSAAAMASAPVVNAVISEAKKNIGHRFPKLTLVDEKYANYQIPEYNNDITLEEFAEGYRLLQQAS
ncbi:MAG: hypothetical protein ACLU6Y_16050 [Ruminococcus sp.]